MSLDRWARRADEALERYLPRRQPEIPDALIDAMRYSAMLPGKRLRPALAYETAEIFAIPAETLDPFAAAIEMIHAYSLIHDDLPCMDDDDLRRGKPTCHRVYGEAMALLAGDGLLSLAVSLMARQAMGDPRAACAMYEVVSRIGLDGIVGGQALDIASEGAASGESILIAIHERKTAALFTASVLCGGALGGASVEEMRCLEGFAAHLGRAFQIADDLLNATGSIGCLGKATGTDEARGKVTAVSVWGIEGARIRLADHTRDACAALAPLRRDAAALTKIALDLAGREA